MTVKIILYLISFLLMIYGLSLIIIYINLFSFGYNIIDYLEFIITNIGCWYFIVGFIILCILIGRNK